MPKDSGNRPKSFELRSHASPYHCGSSTCRGHSYSPSSSQNLIKPATSAEDINEWEEARCPVCMEHPHNAVLLICSSHKSGCHTYMCDTSQRHSNCLDQFKKPKKLFCPLCRGEIRGWTVVEAARKYMNDKTRNCSLESCRFSGTYGELRDHARLEHPYVRPSEADPERQRDWRRMEQHRDLGDVLSTIVSSWWG